MLNIFIYRCSQYARSNWKWGSDDEIDVYAADNISDSDKQYLDIDGWGEFQTEFDEHNVGFHIA